MIGGWLRCHTGHRRFFGSIMRGIRVLRKNELLNPRESFGYESTVLYTRPFTGTSRPLFFLLTTGQVSTSQQRRLYRRNYLQRVTLLFTPVCFFSTCNRTGHVSRGLNFTRVHCYLYLKFTLKRKSYMGLQYQAKGERIIVRSFIITGIRVTQGVGTTYINVPL